LVGTLGEEPTLDEVRRSPLLGVDDRRDLVGATSLSAAKAHSSH
jgi:hypothetical protein